MDDPICCPPKTDTFLADSKVKLIQPEKPRKTTAEIRATIQELEVCLADDLEMPEHFWDEDISVQRKQLETQKEYLLSQKNSEENIKGR